MNNQTISKPILIIGTIICVIAIILAILALFYLEDKTHTKNKTDIKVNTVPNVIQSTSSKPSINQQTKSDFLSSNSESSIDECLKPVRVGKQCPQFA